MQINFNKSKRLHKKILQLPQESLSQRFFALSRDDKKNGCEVTITKSFRKIRLESQWNTTFWVIPAENFRQQRSRFEKVVLSFRTEVKMDQPEFSITNNLYCPGIGKEIYVDFSSLRKQKLLSFI